MREVRVVFGPPGTGKTTTLLNVVDALLEAKVAPSKIAFTSFTRQAANEAKVRAKDRFGFVDDDLPYFRTLHSMAYRELGLTPTDVMDTRDYRAVAEEVGLSLSGHYDYETERVPLGGSTGDACLRIYALSRAKRTSLEVEWQLAEERDLLWPTVRKFARTLDAFKAERGVIDFADMLDVCDSPLPVSTLILDEAQDFTLAQWDLARRLGRNAETVLIAGDDDQALYDWAGSSSQTLRTLEGNRAVLPHSHRLPRAVKSFADLVAGKIRHRVPKSFTARDEDGSVGWVGDTGELDLRQGGTWLLLCRHRYQMAKFVKECKAQGVVYKLDGVWSNEAPSIRAALYYNRLLTGKSLTENEARLVAQYVVNMSPPSGRESYAWDMMPWPVSGYDGKPDWMLGLSRLSTEEMEYLRQLRRNKEPLNKPGRVVISTIHGAKGGEADNVVLATDITGRTIRALQENPDSEHRVWYVGASRAKINLLLLFPSTPRFWTL